MAIVNLAQLPTSPPGASLRLAEVTEDNPGAGPSYTAADFECRRIVSLIGRYTDNALMTATTEVFDGTTISFVVAGSAVGRVLHTIALVED